MFGALEFGRRPPEDPGVREGGSASSCAGYFPAEPVIVARLVKTGEAERRAKIAAPRKGKHRPPYLGRAVSAAHRGRRRTDGTIPV